MSTSKTIAQTKQDDNILVTLTDPNLTLIAKALSSKTRREIIKILNDQELDVSRISKELNQTEANVSAQIKILQKAGLVGCKYQPGGHGVLKICFNAIKSISIEM